ncbi:MAG: glycoside hydrolase family 9 protein, partial [Bacteroidota bacterium]
MDWRKEAIRTFAWAEENYRTDYTCFNYDIRWKRNYAAAALYRLTEEVNYQNIFLNTWESIPPESREMIEDSEAFGAYLYASTTLNSINTSLQNEVLAKLEQTADYYLLDNIDNRACRWGGNIYLPMLIGQPTTPLVFEGLMGYVLLRDKKPSKAANYWKYLHTTADYFLGTNPLNMTWISGLNEHSPKNVFHLDARYDDSDEPIVGVIPYGPWLRQPFYSNIGPWDNHWSEKTVYPAIDEWPGHERWFSQRNVPLASEFTVHQNTIAGAVIYGALSGLSDCQETVSSVEEINEMQQEDLIIFPNPSSGIIELRTNEPSLIQQIEVFDLNGKMLFQQFNVSNQLALSDLLNG